MKANILIIDDEVSSCILLSLALKKDYHVEYAHTAKDGVAMFKSSSFDLVLLDMVIGNDNGLEVLKVIKGIDESASIIMMTAFGSIQTSVEAMRAGAFTYLAKPLDLDELKAYIHQALSMRRLSEEVSFLNDELNKAKQHQEMIGESVPMKQVYSLIERVRDIDCNVLVTGESGTGKELVARAIHYSGRRKNNHFVVVNCAAIPESMLEEELFGHKRGSYAGATQDKKGKLEIADGGTVFLDEIGDISPSLQGKLLRAIQQKEFTPLGGTIVRKVDIRIVAATNRNLQEMVKGGQFREDLYYRLNVMNIRMPSLRERREDIPSLCRHFIAQFSREQNKSVKGLTNEAYRYLINYDYPGNVRQLMNALEYAMIVCKNSEICAEDLPVEISGRIQQAHYNGEEMLNEMLAGRALHEVEKLAIAATLKKNNGRRDITAKELGISVRGLQNKISAYEL